MSLDIRQVETLNSIWFFNVDASTFLRLPKSEAPDPGTQIPYHGEWEEYVSLSRIETTDGYYMLVERPVPFGTGQWRATSLVLSDSHSDRTTALIPDD